MRRSDLIAAEDDGSQVAIDLFASLAIMMLLIAVIVLLDSRGDSASSISAETKIVTDDASILALTLGEGSRDFNIDSLKKWAESEEGVSILGVESASRKIWLSLAAGHDTSIPVSRWRRAPALPIGRATQAPPPSAGRATRDIDILPSDRYWRNWKGASFAKLQSEWNNYSAREGLASTDDEIKYQNIVVEFRSFMESWMKYYSPPRISMPSVFVDEKIFPSSSCMYDGLRFDYNPDENNNRFGVPPGRQAEALEYLPIGLEELWFVVRKAANATLTCSSEDTRSGRSWEATGPFVAFFFDYRVEGSGYRYKNTVLCKWSIELIESYNNAPESYLGRECFVDGPHRITNRLPEVPNTRLFSAGVFHRQYASSHPLWWYPIYFSYSSPSVAFNTGQISDENIIARQMERVNEADEAAQARLEAAQASLEERRRGLPTVEGLPNGDPLLPYTISTPTDATEVLDEGSGQAENILASVEQSIEISGVLVPDPDHHGPFSIELSASKNCVRAIQGRPVEALSCNVVPQ